MENAIAIREATSITAAPAAWDRERIELVKRTVCPQGIGDVEFALFIEQCKRSGLDPLLKQAFCVERRMKLPNGQWGSKHEFQPAEAGMLARAEAFPDFGGITAAAVYEKDEIEIDPGAGEVHHKFRPGHERGKILGAWARICRAGKPAVIAWVNFKDYAQTKSDGQLNSMWAKFSATMITKCARVAALRVAYPAAFGGLYIREEMPAEEFVQRPAASVRVVEQERPQLAAHAGEDAEFTQEAEQPFQKEIDNARAMIASAQNLDDLQKAGKLLGEYPKGHPVRVAVSPDYAARDRDLRWAAEQAGAAA